MKATDWAKKIAANPENLTAILKEFFGEIMTVARAGGGGGSIVSYDNALKQQEAKFRALCRLTNTLAPSMWKSLLKQNFPTHIVAEIEHHRKVGDIGLRPKKRQNQRQRVA